MPDWDILLCKGSINTGSIASATLGRLHLICVQAVDCLAANELKSRKSRRMWGKRQKRKMREEEKGKEEEALASRGRVALSCTNALSGGLE